MRRWSVRKKNDNLMNALAENANLGKLAAGILAARGVEDTDDFLNPQLLFDPFLMKDMDKCVEIIGEALQNGDKMLIFGDYDCDGITGTVMLYNYITALGGEADWYIPSRAEGYGLSRDAVDKITKDGSVKLIITVDNGISAVEEALYIKEKGLKFVITDHHQPPAVLPDADAVLNPKRTDDSYPFKFLAGCGVVLKLIMALEGDIDTVMEQFGDLAAIGTIGDIVPLCGENRYITAQGLAVMPYSENIGLYQLLKISGLCDNGNITSSSVAFGICPRINAAGRISHANEAMKLLLCEDIEQAAGLASRLSELNTERRETENEIISGINEFLTENPERLYERILICEGENYHEGAIGIVSAKLMKKYGKPCMVISINDGIAKGSARSYDGVPLYELLESCGDLLIKYGGHAKAAGFTLEEGKLPEFIRRIQQYAADTYAQFPEFTTIVDYEPGYDELTLENVEKLSALEPFGEGNAKPLFLLKDVLIVSKKPLKDGKYTSFNVRYGNTEQKILDFETAFDDFYHKVGDRIDILTELGTNNFNGTTSISVRLKDIKPHGFPDDKYFAAAAAYEKLRRGEKIDMKLKDRIIPDKSQIMTVYDILRVTASFNEAREMVLKKGLNYCMFCVIIDLLDEFKLINRDIIHNRLELLPVGEKKDFSRSLLIPKYTKAFE